MLIHYTGWRQASGETFFTNLGRGQPMPLNLAQTAPGFTEALQLLHQGEKAMLWMPPDIGYKAPPPAGKAETLVYEVEVVEVQPAPAIPEDVAGPPAKATALKSGTKLEVVRPGTGKDNVRPYDTVSYRFTVWDGTGRMLDSNEARATSHAMTSQPYKQPAGMAEMLTSLTVGERGRFWIDAEKIVEGGRKPPGGVEHGLLCYEIEITQNVKPQQEPPPTPPDVAKPPADAQKTAKGVFYRFLAHGPGKDPRHPNAMDTVKVHYAGWTTDGKMFDSSLPPQRDRDVRADRRDPRVDRRPPGDDARRPRAVLDPRGAGVQGPGRQAAGHAGVRDRAGGDPEAAGALSARMSVATDATVPGEVARAWGWADGAAEIAPLAGGLINATYAVRCGGVPVAVVQRLHPIFAGEVNLDIDAVTGHLAARGLVTPRLVRTREGRAWHEHGGRVWRALSWIDGEAVQAVPDPRWAEAGGALVGRFHRAVADLSHDYAFSRVGVHDTAAHLARLAGRVAAGGDPAAIALGREILDAASGLPEMPAVPRRHCHGDLKISNLLFAAAPVRGVCLVDLDTLGLSTMAFELGDAMRSWCNPHGEDAGPVGFDLAIFAAAIRGFRDVADALLTTDEKIAIVVGLETVCLELAARFAIDAFDDTYFGWDPARFPSRRAHNLVRAQGQLALGQQVRAARGDALEVVRSARPA